MTIGVFASSSSRINNEYAVAAAELGRLFSASGISVVYGGGGIGLMGVLADSMLERGGVITGVIPSFMKDEGWDHAGVSDMIITNDMGERKKKIFSMSNGIVALPGGIGTLEELTEAITLKQLGLFSGPIVILNTLDFYKPLIEFLENMVEGHFLRFEHKGMWEVASTPDEVIACLSRTNDWNSDPRSIARI
jgi:uncharacterized protein (TIGR00730 family)